MAALAGVRELADALRTLPRGATVVVKEIERLPALLNEVYRFIEDHCLRFVLVGTIARKPKPAGANLLAEERRHPKLNWSDSGIARGVRRECHSPAAAERIPLLLHGSSRR